MRIADVHTPVVLLHCGLGALAIMRTLGYLGVKVVGVDNTPDAPALRSRYCHGSHIFPYDREPSAKFADFLLSLRDEFSTQPILIATSDETAIAVAQQHDVLAQAYKIAQNPGDIVPTLADKMSMFSLAEEHNVPAPKTELLASWRDAERCAKGVNYPVMLKGVMGNRLYERTGKKMVVVHNSAEFLEQFRELHDPDMPNLMAQELIPGDDDQVYIFNGYFDAQSNCLAAFTGRKIRQFPIHVGCASLGECCWVEEVAQLTIEFMQKIGYHGILDIGYKKDPRDQKYKVLDINPRVGQAFRIFVSKNNLDVVRALYLDLTRQEFPAASPPREGRRWMIEDWDLTSTLHYFQEHSLSFSEWLWSFRRLEEGAWFALRDPVPFLLMLGRLAVKSVRWLGKRAVGTAPQPSQPAAEH